MKTNNKSFMHSPKLTYFGREVIFGRSVVERISNNFRPLSEKCNFNDNQLD